jgi:hypothetical protein
MIVKEQSQNSTNQILFTFNEESESEDDDITKDIPKIHSHEEEQMEYIKKIKQFFKDYTVTLYFTHI